MNMETTVGMASYCNRTKMRPPKGRWRLAGGFTLIEMLAVIVIIAMLSSVAMLATHGMGRAAGLRAAADLAASMALSARIEAISSGYGSLLVVDNGTSSEHKLQRLAIFRYTTTPLDSDPMNANTGVLAGDPVYLPKGAFFRPADSTASEITLPTPPPANLGPDIFYVRFNGSGQLVSASGVKLIFGGGIMDASGNLTFPAAMQPGRRGILLRKNGRPVFYQTPAQIDAIP